MASDRAIETRRHAMPFGTELTQGGVRFRLWAPKHRAIGLKLEGEDAPRPMQPRDNGWFDLDVDTAQAGTLYQFVLPDGLAVPDPASRFQPRDVHGPSEVIDPRAYRWNDAAWTGRPWEEAVLYELHIGTFTGEGTFRAAIDKLDHLAALGVTAIEIMPVADFPGARNWGYDGVLLFAPDGSYGRPEDLKALVDAAHARGLMVILDVVYNHFGPDGNYLPSYAPVFTETHHTPWGAAVNFDAQGSRDVRELVIQNALYWLREFHMDGLRLDAVHAIIDDSKPDILDELAERVRAETVGRHVHLILENEENRVAHLERIGGSPLHYTAQWNDDLHHVLHAAATGESSGYYHDYAGDTALLARALGGGVRIPRQMMSYRDSPRGEPSGALPPTAFVGFIQNHDQVGNRAFGERITAIAPPEAVRAIAAIYLLCPQIPMLFMGEEWNANEPFPFFCDFDDELADAVRNGRRNEFARFPEFQDPAARERIPDPTAEETFRSAKLDWAAAETGTHAETLDWYKRILAVRRAEIVPRLAGIAGHAGSAEVLGDRAVQVRWTLGDGSTLQLAANLNAAPLADIPSLAGRLLWQEGQSADGTLGPWSVAWSLDR